MVKVKIVLAGNTLGSHATFLDWLARRTNFQKVESIEECDVTLIFCPIVSRVGTDIEAANRQIPASRPGVLVVLHPTFNPEYVIPDTGRFVTRSDIVTVDCLFHDGELLNCSCNEEAVKRVYNYLRGFHREIPVQNPHPNPPHPPPPRDSHSGHPDCLDSVQHPKYMIVGLIAVIIVLLLIGIILLATYA